MQVGDAERGRICGSWRGEEGHGVGNVIDSRRGVGKGVDDDRGLFPSLSRYP